MNLRWAMRRLALMDGAEIRFRLLRFAQARLERFGVGLCPTPPQPAHWRETASGSGAWIEHISRTFASADYLEAADRIVQGEVDLFALRPARLQYPFAWNRDPRTGIVAPLTFGKTMNYRRGELVGDIKYLWELNRHLELVRLAQAWHLSGQDRYAHAAREYLESWFVQCPYPLGPNWSSSLELGLRLINWSVAWQLLQGSPLFTQPDCEEFLLRWQRGVYQHCHFIAGHLSRHSSANNHLLGELAGLLVGALTWPAWPQSRGWAAQAQREFELQCLQQTHADGVSREQATGYHRSVTELMLFVGLVARVNSVDFGAAYWQRLERMLEFIASIMDCGGHVPAFGDADDAVLVRWSCDPQFDAYRSLLATGGLLFYRADLQAKAGILTDASRWLLGDERVQEFRVEPAALLARPTARAYPDGGYFILGSDFETRREVRVVADAGVLGYLAIAAHGHADALSFTLSVAGLEFLIDPGTFAYHAQTKWRTYFRGTSAHNTVRVAGTDQSVQSGPFMWAQRASIIVNEYRSDSRGQKLTAAHNGYERAPVGVRVQRTIEYLQAARTVVVTDQLSSDALRSVEWFWHFSVGCTVTISAGTACVSHQDQLVKLTWPTELTARLVRGCEDPPLGWRSTDYDTRVPVTTLVLSGSVRGVWQGCTRVIVATPENLGT